MNIVTRFAPSPTGLLHAGNYRTAIFAWLFARKNGGKFILRIEDTDRERSKKEYEDNILETLAWLDLNYEETFHQSKNAKRHEEVLRELVERDLAFVSKETPKEEGQRSEVIRFRNPGREITFVDAIRGPITFNTAELGDFVIAKSFTEPIFHFAVVVDDSDEGVTHVIRGEDHISNTARQILVQEAMGADIPIYAHLPLVLAPDRSKLSKRKGAKALTEYRDAGFVPDAMLNCLAMTGWHPGDDEEVFSRTELVERFEMSQIQKSSAMFDEEKLRWFNREHMLRMDADAFKAMALTFVSEETRTQLLETPKGDLVMPLLRERASTFGDIQEMDAQGELSFFYKTPISSSGMLVPKKETASSTKPRLEALLPLLEPISASNWTTEGIKTAIWDYAEKEGRGGVLWPLRVALSGKEKSPDPFTIAFIIGKEETLSRIAAAIQTLKMTP